MKIKTSESGFLSIQPIVFWFSAIVIVIFVIFGVIASKSVGELFGSMLGLLTKQIGWFFIAAANLFLIYSVYLFFSRFGSIRLGGKDAKPEFSTLTWFTMLFSAGMGIGLVFWSVGEPMWHFIGPPKLFDGVLANSPQAAQTAMTITIFHWGFHAWAIYAIMGLSLAYFCFNKGLPLTPRSAFYPLLGDAIYGFWGHLIDILAVFATLFGLATSLGLGAQQVNAGLTYLFGVPKGVSVQIIVIAVITLIAIVSVVTGLTKGIKLLSQFNTALAFLLVIFVFLIGPSLFLFDSLGQNIGSYLGNIIPLGTWTESYRGDGDSWQHSWTVFYWAWWIAWSPFVGLFIARISKGRTIKQFIGGVLFAPTLASIVWLTAFGGTALFQELNGAGGIVDAVKSDVSTAMYALLSNLPLSGLTSFLVMIVVVTFFVTSSDSGSLVVDTITSGGNLHAPVVQRVFWASVEGVVAAILLVSGGLGALQSGSVITGFPFAIILLLMIVSLHKGLSSEVPN